MVQPASGLLSMAQQNDIVRENLNFITHCH